MLRATTSFFYGTRLVRKDEIVADNDPCVKGREALLVAIVPDHPVVEAATAAPGEKRAAVKRTAPKA